MIARLRAAYLSYPPPVGYATAREVVTARRDHNVDLVGPILASTSWQTKDGGGFSQADFTIDWENCQPGDLPQRRDQQPMGRRPLPGESSRDPNTVSYGCRPSLQGPGAVHPLQQQVGHGRRITLRPQAEFEAI